MLLPATALLLDVEWIDSRWVSAVGFACILASCIGKAFAHARLDGDQFLFWQALDAIGFPLVAMPLLMMATNVLAPEEGPFASAMINTPRAVAEAIGVWRARADPALARRRCTATRILETLGADRLTARAGGADPRRLAARADAGRPAERAGRARRRSTARSRRQVTTLTTIDTYS